MALYVLACLLAIIINITFLSEGLCSRLGIRPFALCFPAVCALALAPYGFRPFTELSFDLSVVALPLCLMALCFNGGKCEGKDESGGRRTLIGLLVASIAPILVCMALSLAELIADGYAFIELSAQNVVPWQIACCAFGLLMGDMVKMKKARV